MQKLKGISLVIASGSATIQKCLQEKFASHGANVVLCGFLNLNFVDKLEQGLKADVILIDMNDSYEEDDAALDRLLEKIDLPILFHDNDFDELNDPGGGECFSASAVEKLTAKLARLVDSDCRRVAEELPDSADTLVLLSDDNSESDEPRPVSIEKLAQQISLQDTEVNGQSSDTATQYEAQEKELACGLLNVWILGASIGGPEAVKRFLARVPAELPVAFVLAQHLGDGFVSLLASQLDRISTFNVKEAIPGDSLSHGEVVVVPVDNRMSLDADGLISFIDDDWKGHYKPSIDCMIDDVTSSFKKQSGVIIFSGMGADGVLASQKFVEKYNGSIWAQSPDSCVISSMPDSVRKANLVSYSGSPEALALKISVQYMGKNSYIL